MAKLFSNNTGNEGRDKSRESERESVGGQKTTQTAERGTNET